MTTTPPPAPGSPEVPPTEYRSPQAPIVLTVVGVGFAICLIALLVSRGSFAFETAALALLLAAPFLIYARLALARPGVEAVLGGVLLLAVGIWGAVSAIDADGAGPFVQLSLALVALELVVFAAGGFLRSVVPPRDAEASEQQQQQEAPPAAG